MKSSDQIYCPIHATCTVEGCRATPDRLSGKPLPWFCDTRASTPAAYRTAAMADIVPRTSRFARSVAALARAHTTLHSASFTAPRREWAMSTLHLLRKQRLLPLLPHAWVQPIATYQGRRRERMVRKPYLRILHVRSQTLRQATFDEDVRASLVRR
ncbi:hypothetical protein NLG97_g10123 [Lecanicillium saksenae]|uniref:Uncharacterized protein n=1 Tax=Lecanicillium saksenae TaxID=468837 RepID=A0ACC1QFR5_9HYPO|nr:hypothetical protein NLG97_g10123 [Lecanicillium saksenae]